MNLNQRVHAINELLASNDTDHNKIERREIAIGQHIKAIKKEHPDRWQAIVREKCNVGRSRAFAYMQIADGKPVEAMRAIEAVRKRKNRSRNKARPGRPGPPSGPPKLALVKDADADEDNDNDDKEEALLDQLDKENPEAPFLACVVRAGDSWQLAQQAATCLPGIIEQTKPCAEDWATMVELIRKAADEWTKFAVKVEAMTAPATRRTKRILAA